MDASDKSGEPSLSVTSPEAWTHWTLVSRKRASQPKDAVVPDESFYSCSNLKDDQPGRYVKASDVRAQVAQIPEYKYSPRGKYKHGRKNEYPKRFGNQERFPNLESNGPRIEYPLTPSGARVWRDCDGTGRTAGLHRAICDRDKQYRQGIDVAYHDVTKSLDPGRNLSLATYRSAGEAAEKRRKKMQRRAKHQ